MSLVAEINKKSKNSKIIKIIYFFVFIIIIYFLYNFFFSKEEKIENIKEEKISTVKKWDLKTFIESDWKVVLKNEFNVDFIWEWIIKEIYKNPWDYVESWEKIASLDTNYLDIDILKAQLALKTAQTNYEIKKRWVSDLELDISQKQLDKDNISLEVSQKDIDTQINSILKDIEIAKRDLENIKKEKEIELLQSKNNLDISKIDLLNIVSTSENTIKQEEEKYKSQTSKIVMETGKMITNLEKNLYDIDVLLGIADTNKYQNDSFEIYLWAKNSSLKNMTETSFRTTKTNFDSFYTSWQEYRKNIDFQNLDNFWNIESKVLDFNNIYKDLNKTLSYTIDVLKNSITSSNFSQTTIDNYLNNFENAISQSKKDNSDYISLYQNLQELKISLESKILTQKKDIESSSWKLLISESILKKTILEIDLDIEKANQKITDLEYNLKELKDKKDNTLLLSKAQSDISKASLESKKYIDILELEPVYMAVLQAEQTLKEIKNKKEDSILKSPISWKIVSINANVWESTNILKNSFAIIIDNKNFLAEVYVEEYDIVKVKNNQNVYLNFDAIDWLTLTWKVLYIEDKATIDSNSIVSYKVEVYFVSNDERIKDGMSSTVEFITKEVKNILLIPVESVKNIAWTPSVIMEDWSISKIVSWFTDWKNVEIISWLESWEKVKY